MIDPGPAASVVVADDDEGVRVALSNLVVDHPDLDLAGLAATGGGAAELCARLHPDLAVVDVMMAGGGADAIAAIHAVSPATAVVVYTARSDRPTRTRMVEAGAVSVVVKGGADDIAEVLADLGRRR